MGQPAAALKSISSWPCFPWTVPCQPMSTQGYEEIGTWVSSAGWHPAELSQNRVAP